MEELPGYYLWNNKEENSQIVTKSDLIRKNRKSRIFSEERDAYRRRKEEEK